LGTRRQALHAAIRADRGERKNMRSLLFSAIRFRSSPSVVVDELRRRSRGQRVCQQSCRNTSGPWQSCDIGTTWSSNPPRFQQGLDNALQGSTRLQSLVEVLSECQLGQENLGRRREQPRLGEASVRSQIGLVVVY